YFNSIPRELDEAATLDGAGHGWILFRMLIPLSGPAIAAMTILNFEATWNNRSEERRVGKGWRPVRVGTYAEYCRQRRPGGGQRGRRHLILFWHAEDGIRDRNVTGVQTCALPICTSIRSLASSTRPRRWMVPGTAGSCSAC